jgi:hypothetical protein
VTVITAPAGGAMSVFGSDLARVLDDSETLRVLPILGKGPVQNVIDLLYLKSVDMGPVACDVREFYKLQYNVPDVANRSPAAGSLPADDVFQRRISQPAGAGRDNRHDRDQRAARRVRLAGAQRALLLERERANR